jgi:hypothetical protein
MQHRFRCLKPFILMVLLISGAFHEVRGECFNLFMTNEKLTIETPFTYQEMSLLDGSDTLICYGDSVSLIAPALTPPVQILWSTSDTVPLLSVSPFQTTIYSVMVTNGQDTLYDTTQVMVLVVDAGQDDTICLNDSVALLGVATPYPCIWSPAATLLQPSAYATTAFPQQTTTYTLAVKHCVDSVTVVVIPPPTLTLGPDVTLCQGQPLTLTPGAGYASYHWSNGAFTPTIAVNATGQYWVRVTNASSCAATDTVSVTFNPYPTLTMVPSLDSICAGDTAVIKVTSNVSPVTYAWSVGGTSDSLAVVPTGISIYRVTVTHQGCSSADSSLIILKPVPIPTLYCNKTMICAGETTMIQAATIYPGVSYQWSSGQSIAAINASPTTGTLYTVTASLNGCSSDTSLFIDVNQNPIVQVSVTPPSVCYGDTATFVAVSNIWGTQFQWNGGYTGSQVKLQLTSPVQMTAVGTVNGCVGTDSVWVSIKQVPDITVFDVRRHHLRR